MKEALYNKLGGKTIAIDGKSIRSTSKFKETDRKSALHIASAYVSELKMVIGSKECITKTGEITAFRELIEMLDIEGCMIVADALHCKKESAKAVIKAKADYLLVVKKNEPKLKESIDNHIKNENTYKESKLEKNSGRIEKRTAYVCYEIEDIYNKDKWQNISMIGAIHKECTKNGKITSEWHYYISSKKLSTKELLSYARNEWAVEAMHWLLDVHYGEDKTRVWDANLQKNLNLLRKITKQNLFDLSNLITFLQVLQEKSN
ncbi:hypothetical protein AN639_10850 [Candidatus Epulonipiscium fishelsonii]|uniref:Uncharacterized protein n=1 Tax=Candidatus Epulonipiscium fishelsonii TaxID=77094 RepID=A0ACC8XEB1_9FIRM|nr:hypothetical protein AN396_03650 [Epulopiscium sp. SCG-B11WGA-EpuloA1]ONI43230.1 hypothetical protein AN639_10850 [Epulopiscium sp. SCG-B05WGA-EpuloA1]